MRRRFRLRRLATALAQLRAPLTRDDVALLEHGDFIRQLADRIAPDFASLMRVDVGEEDANVVQTQVSTGLGTYSLLDLWLADAYTPGLTPLAPTSVTFNSGTVLETIVANRRYLVVTTAAGLVDVSVQYTGARTWRWAVSRYGRVVYSDPLYFT